MNKVVLVLFLLALAIPLSAQGKGKGQPKSAQNSSTAGTVASVSVVFSESDRRVIQQWAQGVPPGGLPPGLAKRGELPPGLQKKLSPFPIDLTRRLGPLPAGCGCDRVFLDGKALIIARATSAILDVISLF